VLFRRLSDSEISTEKPLRYEAMTGLHDEQLTELVSRVYAARGGELTSRGRPYALGLFGSVALVVCLMRKNITQEFAGGLLQSPSGSAGGRAEKDLNTRNLAARPTQCELLRAATGRAGRNGAAGHPPEVARMNCHLCERRVTRTSYSGKPRGAAPH
jgi:hypothetical protein